MMVYPLSTPAGVIQITLSEKGIAGIDLPFKGRRNPESCVGKGHLTLAQKKLIKAFGAQFSKYLSGKLHTFKKIPLDLSSCTPFQRKVLNACRRIPAGATVSYRDLARKIKRERASRAVGNALGSNPLPVLIPCHRVVRSSGALGGFTAGTGWKKRLLAAERGGGGFGLSLNPL